MLKMKILVVLLMAVSCFAVPFKVETIKEGAGDTIRTGQLIKVHYKGYIYLDSAAIAKEKAEALAAGDSSYVPDTSGLRQFSNSYDGEPLEFSLGQGQVIEGWEKGLVGMKPGEIRKLYVPYQMAYGENSLEGIPAYSNLYF